MQRLPQYLISSRFSSICKSFFRVTVPLTETSPFLMSFLIPLLVPYCKSHKNLSRRIPAHSSGIRFSRCEQSFLRFQTHIMKKSSNKRPIMLRKIKDSFFQLIFTLLALYLTFLLLRYPARSLEYAYTGLILWFRKMIPTLLPLSLIHI